MKQRQGPPDWLVLRSFRSAFNSLHIIDAVGESSPGRRLHEDLLDIQNGRSGKLLQISSIKISSKQELFNYLDALWEKTKVGEIPFLHIESHGDDTCIRLASGEIVNWDTLKLPLENLNRASDFNLTLSISACFGAHGYQTMIANRAPFLNVLGPIYEITTGELSTKNLEFFKNVLEGKTFKEAIDAINNLPGTPLLLDHSPVLALNGIMGYLEDNGSIQGLRKRLRRNPHTWRNPELAKALRDPEAHAIHMIRSMKLTWAQCFMHDLLPSCKVRFPFPIKESFIREILMSPRFSRQIDVIGLLGSVNRQAVTQQRVGWGEHREPQQSAGSTQTLGFTSFTPTYNQRRHDN
jgi:hypothetical protein